MVKYNHLVVAHLLIVVVFAAAVAVVVLGMRLWLLLLWKNLLEITLEYLEIQGHYFMSEE